METILGIIVVAVILYIIFKPKNNETTNGQNTNINSRTVNMMNNQNLQNSQNDQEIPVAPAPDPEPIVLSFDDTENSNSNEAIDDGVGVSKPNQSADVAPSPQKNETLGSLNFCPYCGKKLDGNFAFCPYCGKDMK